APPAPPPPGQASPVFPELYPHSVGGEGKTQVAVMVCDGAILSRKPEAIEIPLPTLPPARWRLLEERFLLHCDSEAGYLPRPRGNRTTWLILPPFLPSTRQQRKLRHPQACATVGNQHELLPRLGRPGRALRRCSGSVLLQAPRRDAPAPHPGRDRGSVRRERAVSHRPRFESHRLLRMVHVQFQPIVPRRLWIDLPVGKRRL